MLETEKLGTIIYTKGLDNGEVHLLKAISDYVLTGVSSCSLKRCNFFSNEGYTLLKNVVDECFTTDNARIEGCDDNPLDQHYWLAFDLINFDDNRRSILVDPIFGYIGLEENARDVLEEHFCSYYQRKRSVPHGKPYWEGGIRLKTIPL